MTPREFYPDNLKLIILENIVPLFLVFLLVLVAGYFPPLMIRVCVYYYALAFVHYLYLQPLKINDEFIEGPVPVLLWRTRISRAHALVSEEQVFAFRLIRILDTETDRNILFFTNYYKPSTVREVQGLLGTFGSPEE